MAISSLPQLDRLFLTDAGLETDILFNKGIDLPLFSSATLFTSDEGVGVLEAYYRGFLDLARAKGTGLILESATWRASPDWAEPLGFSLAELDGLNGVAIELLRWLRAEYADVVASGGQAGMWVRHADSSRNARIMRGSTRDPGDRTIA